MPNATETELVEACETFKRYIALTIRIHERKKREKGTSIRSEMRGAVQ